MRRKQLFAILLAGTLAAGTVPASVWAAEETATEAAAASVESEEGGEAVDKGAEATEETPAEQPVSETPASTEAPQATQETPASTEAPASETPAQPAGTAGTDAPAATDTTDSAGDSSTAPAPTTETTEDSGISINIDGKDTAFATLAEAVAKAAELSASGTETEIKVTKPQVLTETISITSGKISITAGAADVKFTRGEGFTGKMFDISGNAEVAFKGDTEHSFTLTLDGTDNKPAEGSKTDTLVSVGTGSTFQMTSGVTLTNNTAAADDAAGAITNKGGTLKLEGGTITANKGTNGGVYSDTSVEIKGDVSVSENKNSSDKNANISLGKDAHLTVTGELTGEGKIYATVPTPAADTVIAEIGKDSDSKALVTPEQFARIPTKVYYDDTAYAVRVSDKGDTAVLTVQTPPTSENPPSTTAPSTAAPSTTAPSTTAPSTTAPTATTFKPSISGVTWLDHNTIQFKLNANEAFSYYYTIGKKTYDAKKATRSVKADTKDVVTVSDIPEGSDFKIYVYFKLSDGNHKYAKIPISSTVMKKRPGTASRDAKTYKVSDCTVSGLEDAKKFYPGVFYEFAVTGAGQDNKEPVVGDEKYVPLYWSTSKTPTDKQKNDKWKVGSSKGITKAATYNMYVFFQKYRYDGSDWVKTDSVEYKTVQFKSAEITKDDYNEWKKENPDANAPDYSQTDGGSGGSGDDSDAELTATAAAKDTGSTSKSAVSTADESPIGTMSMLAVLSLLAGGYVIVRKRKKES